MISVKDIETLKKLLGELMKKSDFKTYNALLNLMTDYSKRIDK